MVRRNGTEELQVIIGFIRMQLGPAAVRFLAKCKSLRREQHIQAVRIIVNGGQGSRYPFYPRRRSRLLPCAFFGSGIRTSYAHIEVQVTGRIHGLAQVLPWVFRWCLRLVGAMPDYISQRIGPAIPRLSKLCLPNRSLDLEKSPPTGIFAHEKKSAHRDFRPRKKVRSPGFPPTKKSPPTWIFAHKWWSWRAPGRSLSST